MLWCKGRCPPEPPHHLPLSLSTTTLSLTRRTSLVEHSDVITLPYKGIREGPTSHRFATFDAIATSVLFSISAGGKPSSSKVSIGIHVVTNNMYAYFSAGLRLDLINRDSTLTWLVWAVDSTLTWLHLFFNDLTQTWTLETRPWTWTRGIVTQLQHCLSVTRSMRCSCVVWCTHAGVCVCARTLGLHDYGQNYDHDYFYQYWDHD